jgi:hypothetical protein
MTAAMVSTAASAGAQSGPRNQDTFFTFSQPVELPKTTLPAGTYFFQLMDSDSNRHIVKVMSQDRKQLHATLLAIPFYSNDRPLDEPQVRFMETPAKAGAPATNAIKLWFYPGNSVGHEFIYPREQAMRIAARTGESVLTTKTDTEATETGNDAELTHVDANGANAEASTASTQTASNQTTASESTPTPSASSETTSSRTASAPSSGREPVGAITGNNPAPVRSASRTDLPATAGPLPLLALIGLGSLVGSRILRKAQQ